MLQILQREEGTQGHVGFVVSTVGRIVTVYLNCYGLAPPQPFSGLGKFRLQSLGLSGAYGRYLQHSFLPSCGENILTSMGAIGPLFWSFSPLLTSEFGTFQPQSSRSPHRCLSPYPIPSSMPLNPKPYSPPDVDRIWGIWGSSYNIPKPVFYLL